MDTIAVDNKKAHHMKLVAIFKEVAANLSKETVYAEPFYEKNSENEYIQLPYPKEYACNLLIYGKESAIANLFNKDRIAEFMNKMNTSVHFKNCFTMSERRYDINEYMEHPSPLRVFNLATLILGTGYYSKNDYLINNILENENENKIYILSNRNTWLDNAKEGLEKLVTDALNYLSELDNSKHNNTYPEQNLIINILNHIPACLLNVKSIKLLIGKNLTLPVLGGQKRIKRTKKASPKKKSASKRKSPAAKKSAAKKK